ncbi:hypothetical protein GGR56DRAFT_648805 [Xylariaceae sp. FL0804]|nr:hypothetical protein GGR56DRAFT_648805 [Xylariaceae sp. FL0804]
MSEPCHRLPCFPFPSSASTHCLPPVVAPAETMAEAIATLGLVCSVMQVLDFSKEVFELLQDVARDGSPDSDLASNAAHLKALTASIQDELGRYDPVAPRVSGPKAIVEDSRRETDRIGLKNLASDLARNADRLADAVSRVTVTASSSRWERVKAVSKYKLKYQRRIASLQQSIKATQGVMDTEFLSRVCSSTQASHARTQERFNELDQTLRHFIEGWAEGKRTMSDLISTEAQETRDLVSTEAELTRGRVDQISTALDQEASRRRLDEITKRLLSTLWFPEMNERENGMEEPSEQTVDYIFHSVQEDQWSRPITISFVDWVKSDQKLYWISGKPGSGKSTLVRFLARHYQTKKHLLEWRPSPCILRFFFFELGKNLLQKQLRGCLRTLLYQTLNRSPDVLEELIQPRPELESKTSDHDWSKKELCEVFLDSLRLSPSDFCIFIDGLDEIQTDERGSLIAFLETLEQLDNVKICVSSRPETLFKKTFETRPSLRVQDLTYNVICEYAMEAMQVHHDSIGVSEQHYRNLAEDLAWKSEGVFLWAALAVKSLIRGIQNGDSWDVLRSRVSTFAPGLNELYEQMWQRHNEDLAVYRAEAAELFWYTFYEPKAQTSLICCRDAQTEVQRLIRSKGHWAEEDNPQILRKLDPWLYARSAGLVEAVPDPIEHKIYTQFIHRSVQEFLGGTKLGQEIIDYGGTSAEWVSQKWLARASQFRASGFIAASRQYWDPKDGLNITAESFICASMIDRPDEGSNQLIQIYREWLPLQIANPEARGRVVAAAATAGEITFLHDLGVDFIRQISLHEGNVSPHPRWLRPLVDHLCVVFFDSEEWAALFKRQRCCLEWFLENVGYISGVPEKLPIEGMMFATFVIGTEQTAEKTYERTVAWTCLSITYRQVDTTRGRLPHIRECLRLFHKHRGCDSQDKSITMKWETDGVTVTFTIDITWFLEAIDVLVEESLNSRETRQISGDALSSYGNLELIDIREVHVKEIEGVKKEYVTWKEPPVFRAVANQLSPAEIHEIRELLEESLRCYTWDSVRKAKKKLDHIVGLPDTIEFRFQTPTR